MKAFKRIWLIAAVGILSLTLWVSPAAAITNGTPDTGVTAHTNVGILYTDLPLTYGFCTGSLLAANELLVAGHCTAALQAYVDAGALELSAIHVSFEQQLTISDDLVISTDDPIGVTGLHTHPGFWSSAAGAIGRNDVGVVDLAASVQAEAIDLPDIGFLDEQAARAGLRGHEFTVVGYGLQTLDRYWLSPQASWTIDGARYVGTSLFLGLTKDLLAEGPGTCLGDSGGPHFYGATSNLVVAVTSTGSPTCTMSAPGAQRLDTKAVHDWLELYR